ncbi:copper homeostasis protein CutC [Palleronia sp. LCG004]|uniref:copper homeostasis protein CutC n=1 Tax=Palleronia sp. LCG004 TaxID=3079304 RepID=UPI002941D27C|nr:copper homeostasis protein CutC [Palleronia sp. LCG004]WOI58314.1 copper homeostasis protein CutC [Palleronia sp. LCG004]
MSRTLEICVDSHAGLMAAVTGGAHRIELCAALALGGLTPSEALMRAAARCPVPAYAMIRPRDGDFLFSDEELSDMETEIDRARALGLAGVVLGAGSGDGLDLGALDRLAKRAEGMGRTLHRVIDLLPTPATALGSVADLGFERVLTSGGAVTAPEGAATIAEMVRAAPPGLSIMAGSGIRPENAAELIAATGVREIHSSASAAASPPDADLVRLGFAPTNARRTDPEAVARLSRALTSV